MTDQFQREEKLKTVCGGIIQDPNRYPSAFYQEKRVYFCTRACLRAFEKAPNAFMRGEVDHPTDEE